MKRFASALGLILFILYTAPSAIAANTVMSIIPGNGDFAAPFTASLVIDGHGDTFNAAGARVTLSKNLAISDLTLGDCRFSFLKTPSTRDPSFEGVVLNDKQKKCTLYTLSLIPLESSQGSIKITQGTVKRYGDAAEILSYAQNGIYSLTKSAEADLASLAPIVPASQEGLYTLGLKIVSEKGVPITNASVSLTNNQPKTLLEKTSDTNGSVYFTDLQADVYVATISAAKYLTSQNIFNITGPESMIQLNIKMQTNENRFIKPIFWGTGILIIFLAFIIRYLRASKNILA